MTQGKPPEPPTVKMTAAPEWAVTLANEIATIKTEMRSFRVDVCDHLHELENRAAANERDVKSITGQHVAFTEATELKLKENSLRVKAPSEHDLAAQTAIAEEVLKREKLALDVAAIREETKAQTVMLSKLEAGAAKIFANPMVRTIVTMAGTFLLTWLAAHQGQPPPAPQIHVTPIVVDAGPPIHPAVQP